MTLGRMRRLSQAVIGLTVAMTWLSTAQAGTIDRCREREPDNAAFSACIEAEQHRSMNQLRAATLAAEQEVGKQVRETGRKAALREFRAAQARHVRQRAAACRKATAVTDRRACEADVNFSHIEKLKLAAR